MSRRGFYTMARGYFDHPFFAREPFTEREAFQWMVENAAFEPSKVRVARATISLERGQIAFALRFLATRWQWSEPRVRRFLKRLESDAMVLVQATREATQITICNYDKHQLGRRTGDAQTDAQNVTTSTHRRRKEEELKELKEVKKEEEEVIRSVAVRPLDEHFESFKKSYPKRKGPNPWPPARKLFDAAVKRGVDPVAIISAVRAGVGFDREKIGTEFVPHARRWLHDKCWEDHQPPPSENRVFQPPPGAPSDSELRAKYEREAAASNHGNAESAGDNPEELCSESPPAREAIGRNGVSDDHPRKPGMRGLGEILRSSPTGPTLGLSGFDRGDH